MLVLVYLSACIFNTDNHQWHLQRLAFYTSASLFLSSSHFKWNQDWWHSDFNTRWCKPGRNHALIIKIGKIKYMYDQFIYIKIYTITCMYKNIHTYSHMYVLDTTNPVFLRDVNHWHLHFINSYIAERIKCLPFYMDQSSVNFRSTRIKL